MEHRWGQRQLLSKSVQLRTPRGPIGWGQLCDVSLSGAFIQTAVAIPTLSRVQVVFAKDHSREAMRLDAQVVRRTAIGLGLEWSEFGTDTIKALMTSLERRGPLAHPPVHVSHEHPKTKRGGILF
jgi:hypothetical protein